MSAPWAAYGGQQNIGVLNQELILQLITNLPNIHYKKKNLKKIYINILKMLFLIIVESACNEPETTP